LVWRVYDPPDWSLSTLNVIFLISDIVEFVTYALVVIGLAAVFRDISGRFEHIERALMAGELDSEPKVDTGMASTKITDKIAGPRKSPIETLD
jgi:hypothetical protein